MLEVNPSQLAWMIFQIAKRVDTMIIASAALPANRSTKFEFGLSVDEEAGKTIAA